MTTAQPLQIPFTEFHETGNFIHSQTTKLPKFQENTQNIWNFQKNNVPLRVNKQNSQKKSHMPTLTWIGKEKVVNHHLDVPFRVLDRQYTFGDTPDSGNKIIHGDNLEALKALLPEYEGKIKCIYIDPPYNTGNEKWVYNDNVNDPHIRKWLGQVVGSEMDDLTRHDKWLCMMYPRLVLLQRLLSEDGSIFISIDDNEVSSLRFLCHEIFGQNNYINQISIKSKVSSGASGGGEDKKLKKNTEYILWYVKCKDSFNFVPIKEKIPLQDYIEEHKKSGTGFYYTRVITDYGQREYLGTIKDGTGGDIHIYKHHDYKFSNIGQLSKSENCSEKQIYEKYINDIFMVTNAQSTIPARVSEFVGAKGMLISYDYVPSTGRKKGQKETKFIWNETLVVWLRDSALIDKSGVYKTEVIGTLWDDLSWGRLDLEGGITFKNGKKPIQLIQRLFEMAGINKDDIVLDSFAGSGSTAHAVLDYNFRKNTNNSFILVEMCDYVDTITSQRIKNVIAGYQSGKNAVEGTGGSFDFYELGDTLFDPKTENLNDNADTEQIRQYVWYSETHAPYIAPTAEHHPYWLGTDQRTNYYFYYIKGEETCLSWDFLRTLTPERDKAEMYIIYADRCVLTESEMQQLNIRFKKIPRDIKRV